MRGKDNIEDWLAQFGRITPAYAGKRHNRHLGDLHF